MLDRHREALMGAMMEAMEIIAEVDAPEIEAMRDLAVKSRATWDARELVKVYELTYFLGIRRQMARMLGR